MIAKLSALFGVLTALAGAWVYLDNQYVGASEYKLHENHAYQVEQDSIQTIRDLRVQILSDQLSELDMKEKLSPSGLSKWDEIRQQSLERQWEVMLK